MQEHDLAVSPNRSFCSVNKPCVYVCVWFRTAQLSESPLVAVMSHLLSFLEQYSHFQQLQQQADQYRVQLKRHRVQHRRQMKALRASYRQRLRDKNSIISSLEEAISQQQTPSPLSEGEGGREGPQRRGRREERRDGGRVKLRCKRVAGVRMMKNREKQRSCGCFNNHTYTHTEKWTGWCEQRSRKWHRGPRVDLKLDEII